MANQFVSWLPGKAHIRQAAVPVFEKSAPASSPPTQSPVEPQRSRIVWTLLGGLILLHLSNPLGWGLTYPGAWFPPAAIGVLLAAWAGRSAGLVIALDAILVALQATALGSTASVPNLNFAILQIHAAVSGFCGHGVDHGGATIGGFGTQ